MKQLAALFFSVLFFSCNKKKDTPLFQLMEQTGIQFQNSVTDNKNENSFLFRNFYNGGGVAIGDINNDGLGDVFLTSNMGENKLYLNKGAFTFQDISKQSGLKQDSMWSTGVTLADVNGDGWLDIYVCNSGHMRSGNRKNKLYINNHNLTFTESAAAYGLDISAYTTQVSFFDYDGDGDLDCFMINNSPIPVNVLDLNNRRNLPDAQWPVASFLKGGGDHLFQNTNGHFKEVTKESGIHGGLISFGLGVSVGDINGDGWPDVFVSNDSYERDYLYINQKNGTFKDELEQWMGHTSFSSMGADVADINNDGVPEIFSTDMLPSDDYRLKTLGAFDNIDLYRSRLKAGFYHQYMMNCLQLNNGDGTFSDIANYSGVPATDWSWGALLFDMDNDGYNDIYVCNGVNKDVTNLDFMDFFANDVIQKMVLTGKKEEVDQVLKEIPVTPMLNKAFRNNGHLKFSDVGEAWGFTQASFSNGAAYGDLDNDGDLDLVINNINEPAFVYKNNAREINKNNFIGVVLKGIGANTFAVGSTIKVYQGNNIFTRELVPSRGFQSSVDYKTIIGLGKGAVDSLIVVWPNRTYTKLLHPQMNQTIQVQQPADASPYFFKTPYAVTTLLQPAAQTFDKHTEDDYVDFYYERNIPEMLSREGPKATVGDVNGDGLDDIYIGGAAGQAGQLYLQTTAGTFVKKEVPVFQQYADFEDVAVLFFDCDGDHDLDLFIGPGGNNAPPLSRQTQLHLYKNDGQGNFTLDASAFPNNGSNINIAVADDFDNDGDLDLFVGGRNVPMNYGVTPSSYLFVNDGNGHFTDMAKTKSEALSNVGMVTGAIWADVTGDGKKELVIAGEWMAPRIFSFSNGSVTELKSNLNNLYGWWQTVTAGDVNGDGKTDLVFGNIGENFYLRPDSANPVKLWINDFNGNGTTDKILTRTVDGKDVPVFLKRDMQDQIPAVKKAALKHSDFAKKAIQDLFPADVLSKCIMKPFNYPSSCVAINNGNGNFTVQKLPAAVQLSSVNAIHAMDTNGDGKMDLIIGGNQYNFLPQFERLDASFGNVLLGNGKGGFTCVNATQSGLQLRGEVRDIVEVHGKNKKSLLFLRNDDYPALYSIKEPVALALHH